MDPDLVRAMFAIYLVGVSLIRLLSDDADPDLMLIKSIWGRSRGLLLLFLTHVVVPSLFGLFYLCRGIVALAA